MTRFLFVAAFLVSASPALAAYEANGCDQNDLSVTELEKIAQAPEVKSMQDFLDRLPKDKLPTFTFVTNSLSLQRGAGEGKVSALWPRVLRARQDGRVTISFVCDPKNPHYGKVEVVYVDEKDRVRTVEWDFTRRDAAPKDRVHRDPVSCVSCHQGTGPDRATSLKFNWPEYFSWGDCQRERGITLYGFNDDSMTKDQFRPRYDAADPENVRRAPRDCDDQKYKAAYLAQLDDYRAFREAQKDNACFNSLPWPKEPPPNASPEERAVYESFPYRRNPMDDTVRPNLSLTNAYTRLTAKRIARQLKEDPVHYQEAKYLVAMEGAGCPRTAADEGMVEKVFGSQLSSPGERPLGTPTGYDPSSDAPLLYALGKKAGLKNADWTLEFQETKDPAYHGGDGSVAAFTAGEVLRDIVREDPAVAKLAETAFSLPFAKSSCLDETSAATIKVRNSGGMAVTNEAPLALTLFCNTLRASAAESALALQALREQAPSCFQAPAPSAVVGLADSAQRALAALDAEAVARGHALVQAEGKGKCVTCHSAGADSGLPPDFRFVPDDRGDAKAREESRDVMRARTQEGFLKTVDHRLLETKTMPPFESKLTDDERRDIKSYLESLGR